MRTQIGKFTLIVSEQEPGKVRLSRETVRKAFKQAQSECGTKWKLRGRNHDKRVTLKAHISGPAAEGATESFDYVQLHTAGGPTRVFPLNLVRRAVEILGIRGSEIISRHT